MALCFYNISPAVLHKLGWYIKNSWFFLSLFFFKTINFLEKNFGSWWPTLSLMACIISGIGVTRYRVVSHRNSCTLWQKYKKALTFELVKKKNRKFYWPGQRHDPDNDPGDDPGNDSCDNLGVKKNTKYIWKIVVKQKRHYTKCIKPSQKWEPVGHRRIMRQA